MERERRKRDGKGENEEEKKEEGAGAWVEREWVGGGGAIDGEMKEMETNNSTTSHVC